VSRRELANRRIAITGASSGIGRALAVELARVPTKLVLNARREEKLRELAGQLTANGAACECVVGDITDPATRQAIADRAQAAFGGLDILVNNAGVGALGRFEEGTPDRVRRVLEVDFFALVELTRTALPLLKQGQQPLIVNVSSILGHVGIPFSSEYCASKFAVRGFSQSLRAELSVDGVDVLLVSPGTTETEFYASVIDRHGKLPWEGWRGVTAEFVAQATVRAMRSGRHEIIPNPRGRLFCWLQRFSPRLVDAILRRIASRR
jgi:short-subunit dehydrogenase